MNSCGVIISYLKKTSVAVTDLPHVPVNPQLVRFYLDLVGLDKKMAGRRSEHLEFQRRNPAEGRETRGTNSLPQSYADVCQPNPLVISLS